MNSNSCPDLKHLHNLKYWKRGRLLGRGSFAEVRLYTHTGTQLVIAVKEVKFDPSDTSSIAHMEALTNEINHLTNLSHNRIVTFLGSLTDNEEYILSVCLEFTPGGSLFTLLKKDGKLNLRTTIQYTRQILEGVSYLHQQRVIHRDIKGKNILIKNFNNIKLADFGISKQIETLSQTHGANTSKIGTIQWMAPEVITGKEYGLKVDLWSVGCTVVEMLTTHPPWNELVDTIIIKNVCDGLYPIYSLPDIRHEVKDFLHQCFQKNPARRPSAEELLRANLCKLSIAGEIRYDTLKSRS